MTDHLNDYLDGKLSTSNGEVPKHFGSPVPDPTTRPDGQHESYWVLSPAERAKGFVRPLRYKYIHTKCGTITRMGLAIAETYARDPQFYGSTFCCACHDHFPVGEHGEFIWDDASRQKVGT